MKRARGKSMKRARGKSMKRANDQRSPLLLSSSNSFFGWSLVIFFVGMVTLYAEPPKDAKYVGIEKCKMCHSDVHSAWETTGHGKAFQLLVNMGEEKNEKCVACHTTGFGKGGFESLEKTPGFTNVQCEACHGPGSAHVGGPSADTIQKNFPAAVCAKCHLKFNIHPTKD